MTEQKQIEEEKNKNLNKVFELIQTGKKCEASNDFWNASKRFVEASQILKALSTYPNKTKILSENQISNDENQDKGSLSEEKNEDEKILLLFKKESKEYKIKAQTCFIQALQKYIDSIKMTTNTDDDESLSQDSIDLENRNDIASSNNRLSNKEKNNLFQQIFAPKLNDNSDHNDGTLEDKKSSQLTSTTDTTSRNISTLEERLNALTIPQTLPPIPPTLNLAPPPIQPNNNNKQDFETRLHLLKDNPSPYHNLPTSERLKKIHQGMERLGISITVNRGSSTNGQNYANGTETMSEDDQVAWLLSVVKDELDLDHIKNLEDKDIYMASKDVDSTSIKTKVDDSGDNITTNDSNDYVNKTEGLESSNSLDNNFKLSESDQVTQLLSVVKDELDFDDENDNENGSVQMNVKALAAVSSGQKINEDNSDVQVQLNDDSIHKMETLEPFNSMDDKLMEENDMETLSEDEQVTHIISAVKDELHLESLNNNENENITMDSKAADHSSSVSKTDGKRDDLGVEGKKSNVNKTDEDEPFKSTDEDNNNKDEDYDDDSDEDSNDSETDKIIDLIYQTQDLLLTAGSVLDGEETAKDPKKRTESILRNANALILKAIDVLKK